MIRIMNDQDYDTYSVYIDGYDYDDDDDDDRIVTNMMDKIRRAVGLEGQSII